jgi:CheY-like chemotaxis protein/anti-sigma regulatory factor (Ser/Thr protein kinase)
MDRSVLVVDDVAELRSVLCRAIRLRGGFTVVADVADGAAAVTAAARHQPDIIVLDLGLPDLAGHEVLTMLRAVSPGAQIVVYTGSISPDKIELTQGVEAFVTKDHDIGYLVDLLARLSRHHQETALLLLGPDPRDVATGRRFVIDRCRDWDCGDVVEDAEIVASELVTNALVHGQSRAELRVGVNEKVLRIQVIDQGPGIPDPQAAELGDEHGRGLLLISVLCAAWGVEGLPDGGKVVWAELLRSRRDSPAERRPGPGAARLDTLR